MGITGALGVVVAGGAAGSSVAGGSISKGTVSTLEAEGVVVADAAQAAPEVKSRHRISDKAVIRPFSLNKLRNIGFVSIHYLENAFTIIQHILGIVARIFVIVG